MTASGAAPRRDPLACSVVLHRFELWRAAVAALAAAALAVLAGWGASEHGAAGSVVPWVAAAAAFALVALAILLFRVDAGTLCRQAGQWTFEPMRAGPGSTAESGELAVALDLGAFMLFVFDRHGAGPGPARRWLPAQRRGLEQQWQLLRCAVHAARPLRPAAPDAAAAPE